MGQESGFDRSLAARKVSPGAYVEVAVVVPRTVLYDYRSDPSAVCMPDRASRQETSHCPARLLSGEGERSAMRNVNSVSEGIRADW